MELRLRDHLAKLFNEQKKSKKDVKENPRAMAKLLKEAQRLKTVLSANAEHVAQVGRGCTFRDVHVHTHSHAHALLFALFCKPSDEASNFIKCQKKIESYLRLFLFQIEGLMDDIDFKAKVTRAEFEALCPDLFDRVALPVQQALAVSEMSLVSVSTCVFHPFSFLLVHSVHFKGHASSMCMTFGSAG